MGPDPLLGKKNSFDFDEILCLAQLWGVEPESEISFLKFWYLGGEMGVKEGQDRYDPPKRQKIKIIRF